MTNQYFFFINEFKGGSPLNRQMSFFFACKRLLHTSFYSEAYAISDLQKNIGTLPYFLEFYGS